mmetsp:Transcript_36464/g.83776  ORF Transcript_36464/g.83776 Transcript_36464/m.83776 type:complete len:217 (-) Transcript_36464:1475-2125(-)
MESFNVLWLGGESAISKHAGPDAAATARNGVFAAAGVIGSARFRGGDRASTLICRASLNAAFEGTPVLLTGRSRMASGSLVSASLSEEDDEDDEESPSASSCTLVTSSCLLSPRADIAPDTSCNACVACFRVRKASPAFTPAAILSFGSMPAKAAAAEATAAAASATDFVGCSACCVVGFKKEPPKKLIDKSPAASALGDPPSVKMSNCSAGASAA